MSTRESEVDGLPSGSWEMSGTESLIMVRLVLLGEDEDCVAIQVFEEGANDLEVKGITVLTRGVDGRDAKEGRFARIKAIREDGQSWLEGEVKWQGVKRGVEAGREGEGCG